MPSVNRLDAQHPRAAEHPRELARHLAIRMRRRVTRREIGFRFNKSLVATLAKSVATRSSMRVCSRFPHAATHPQVGPAATAGAVGAVEKRLAVGGKCGAEFIQVGIDRLAEVLRRGPRGLERRTTAPPEVDLSVSAGSVGGKQEDSSIGRKCRVDVLRGTIHDGTQVLHWSPRIGCRRAAALPEVFEPMSSDAWKRSEHFFPALAALAPGKWTRCTRLDRP